MVSTLKSSIEKRLSVYESEESYTIASVLDPRFKVRWCDEEKLNEPLTIVRLKASQTEIFQKNNPSEEELSLPKKKPKSNFFNFMSPSRPKPKRSASVGNELDNYLSEPCMDMDSNPLEYWSINCIKYPVLAKLASKYLAIPATSAPVERLFSVAGKTFRPERCRLSDEKFEKLMTIKCNIGVPELDIETEEEDE